jgi:hypothetical protein
MGQSEAEQDSSSDAGSEDGGGIGDTHLSRDHASKSALGHRTARPDQVHFAPNVGARLGHQKTRSVPATPRELASTAGYEPGRQRYGQSVTVGLAISRGPVKRVIGGRGSAEKGRKMCIQLDMSGVSETGDNADVDTASGVYHLGQSIIVSHHRS